jgi:hypothetical protein
MIGFIINFILFYTVCSNAYAGGAIVAALAGNLFAASIVGQVIAFAINMVASSILSKVFAPDAPTNSQQALPNPGNRQQIPPAGDNKLPVVYGTAYVGGIITDMSISEDNQDIYWVMSLSEVTNTESGGLPDEITFGDVYWGGKKCIFDSGTRPVAALRENVEYRITTVGTTDWIAIGATSSAIGTTFIKNGNAATGTGEAEPTDQSNVYSLLDESTGEAQIIFENMNIYLYKNGSFNPSNSLTNAVTVMNAENLIYTWDDTKLMSNTAFAIVHIKYNQDLSLTGLNQTRFQITNARKAPGDCFLDYLSSERYGAAIPLANINTTSLTALNTYSNASFTYTPYTGGSSTQPRFQFNGSLDTNLKIMQNIQAMSDCCDCLVKYNEITGKWGVVTQTPSYSVAMDINDTNMIGGITVSPIDLNNSFNIIEVKFPDGSAKDSFNSATFDLATIAPTLLFDNEPVNKQSVNLYLTNNNVTAQYLANRMLEAAREDLQLQVEINFIGLELEAGDIVTVTNANYGWVAKLFRINKVIQKFGDDGKITASLYLMEYNPAVYDDVNITQFTPSPNTGIGSPITFGTISAPVITNAIPTATNPAFSVIITTSSAGITQYAELWYSAYATPTPDQLIFAGTSAIQSNGNPYGLNEVLPDIQLFNIPSGNWYFFSRMVNQIATSNFSPPSIVYNWRPTTFQYVEKYLSVAYADDEVGAGFSLSPTNKFYYGLYNTDSSSPSLNPNDYNWYPSDPDFGTNIYLVYVNRTGRKFSFDTDFADYASGSGAFVPTTATKFDSTLWSALDPTSANPNIIDLDTRTGQLINTGTTGQYSSEGLLNINNTSDGRLIAKLDQFITFPDGGDTYSTTVGTLTIDRFGRVVGFAPPDDFFMTIDNFTATASQTVFTVTRASTYLEDQCLVFQNGLLLDETEYTDTNGATGTVTLATGANLNDRITIISMRAIANGNTYVALNLTVLSTSGNNMTWDSANMPFQYILAGDKITFSNSGTPTQYTVSSVNYATQTITFTGAVTATAGQSIYQYRALNSSYPVFSRFTVDLTDASNYLPTEWAVRSGYESLFLNGTIVNEQDYDIATGGIITGFPSTITGKLTNIQFSQNNLTTPTGSPLNIVAYTVSGQSLYSFNFTTGSLSVYANGVILVYNVDYTSATNTYTFTITPDNSSTVLVQQTLARAGAA